MLKRLSPYWIINLSFITLILIGSLLLSLPISVKDGYSVSYIDALFMATSAVTITGLTVISDIHATLTTFGQVTLVLLVQIGGLSVITLSVFILTLFKKKIGINDRKIIKESLNQNSLSGVVKMVKKIVLTALTIEGIVFIINLFVFIPMYDLKFAIGASAFHAISAFNNAGFDILGSTSLQGFSSHLLLNLNTSFAIMMGGLGFVVIHDILEKRSFKNLSIHSKIVIKMNLILWIGGMLIFKITQNHQTSYTWLESFFLSVTARTAGFANVNMTELSVLTVIFLLILMFIGAAPASTGGGIKVTTFYTMYHAVKSYATGKAPVVYKRVISNEAIHKSFVLIMLALGLIFGCTVLILVFDDLTLSEALIEVVSGFANVGLSMDKTTTLSNPSKLVISGIMFAGRVGPLTLISVLNTSWNKAISKVEYIEEKVIIG